VWSLLRQLGASPDPQFLAVEHDLDRRRVHAERLEAV
jgi:hypothetical protein